MNATKSTDGFQMGERIQYQTYRQNGKRSRVVQVEVVEIRATAPGRFAAIGRDTNGRRFWLYSTQRV